MSRKRSTLTRRGPLAIGPALGLLVASLVVGTVAAAQDWTFTLTPSSMVEDVATDIRITVRNVSSDSGSGNDIGCIRVQAPSRTTVISAAIQSVSDGQEWRVSTSGSSGATITASAASKTDRLSGNASPESVVIRVRAKSSAPGAYTWSADASSDTACKVLFDEGQQATVVVTPSGNSTPSPTPRATPRLTPAATPKPTAKPTPGATPRPTSSPSPIPTASPGPSASPVATGAGSTHPSSTPPPAAGLTLPGAQPGFAIGSGPEADSMVLVSSSLDLVGQLSAWVVPGLAMMAPGLLVLLAVLLQVVGGAGWLPVVRRHVGDLGFRRRSTRGR